MLMTPPKRQYFRVTSGPCWEALMAWRTEREHLQDRYLEFAKAQGGTGFYAGHDDNVGNATAISAVTFEGDLPKGWKPRRWNSFVVKEGQTPAWPDKRTVAGKAALAEIKAMPLRPSSNRIADAIGFPHSLKYHGKQTVQGYSSMGVFDTVLAGWLKETFYIALPHLSEERQKLIDQGYTVETPDWAPLAGMEPILKEEMDLEVARAELAKATA